MTVEERLARVEARLDINQLEAEYARTWDTCDADAWASCFTADGSFEMCGFGERRPRRFCGHLELAEFCRATTDRYEGIHLINPGAVDITGDTATGWVHFSYFDRDRTDPTVPVRQVAGVYSVLYVHTAAGWRMRRRREQAVLAEGTFHGFPEAKHMWQPAPVGADWATA